MLRQFKRIYSCVATDQQLRSTMSETMNIYVGNLPYKVRDDELREKFEAFGAVTSAEVIIDRRTQRSRGYGFVEMSDDNAAREAISALNGSEMHGRELRVDESLPKNAKREGRAPESRQQPADGDSMVASTDAEDPNRTGFMGFLKKIFG